MKTILPIVFTLTAMLAAPGLAHDTAAKPGAHDHGTEAHGQHDHAAHGSGGAVDQAGLSDLDAIRALQTAMFNTPDNPLEMGPVVISGEYAVSDWAQGEMAGRALLRKTDKCWAIHLCSGASLKDAAALVGIGVPEADAHALAHQLAQAEASIDPAILARYDSFDGTMMVDDSLI